MGNNSRHDGRLDHNHTPPLYQEMETLLYRIQHHAKSQNIQDMGRRSSFPVCPNQNTPTPTNPSHQHTSLPLLQHKQFAPLHHGTSELTPSPNLSQPATLEPMSPLHNPWIPSPHSGPNHLSPTAHLTKHKQTPTHERPHSLPRPRNTLPSNQPSTAHR